MNKIIVEVSIGELLDKISILEIKQEKIKDTEKLKFISNEHSILKKQLDKNKILMLSQASSLMADKTNIGNCFYKVQTKTLKDLYTNGLFRPTIIKCDIEGGEYIIYPQLIEIAKTKGKNSIEIG